MREGAGLGGVFEPRMPPLRPTARMPTTSSAFALAHQLPDQEQAHQNTCIISTRTWASILCSRIAN